MNFYQNKLNNKLYRMNQQCKKYFTVMLSFLLLCLLFVTVTGQDFKPFNRKYAFLVVTTSKASSHDEASRKCNQMRSELAIIKSPEMLSFILKLINNSEYGKQQHTQRIFLRQKILACLNFVMFEKISLTVCMQLASVARFKDQGIHRD